MMLRNQILYQTVSPIHLAQSPPSDEFLITCLGLPSDLRSKKLSCQFIFVSKSSAISDTANPKPAFVDGQSACFAAEASEASEPTLRNTHVHRTHDDPRETLDSMSCS
ncbi:hypothetical protein LshimejAT787_0803170 [Lyophyllum shimeji]|uniref:Uncharacterized protein n=1 Tax=Lyophyllum shimeji TaxID=47721 RepID=A0A9P3PRK9_LYOSH|nr:hypothetical protein LshimejAT787_0803170 [Lyophyllum shimeji]